MNASSLVPLLLLASAGPPGDEARPNVVFILADDLGVMDVEPYNPETFYDTPNLCRLASRSMRFTAGYAANPVCSPTRYSIMTGKYPTRVGATNWFSGVREARFRGAPLNDRMPLEEVTLAEAMRDGGYRTAFLGKWHLGPTEEFWPEHQGFEVNVGGARAGSPPGGYFAPYDNPRMESGPEGEYLTDRLADEAAALIERFREEPFLVYLSFHSVHTPLQAPEDRTEPYREEAAWLGVDDASRFAPVEQVWPDAGPREVRVVQDHPTYAAMVSSMDRAVGVVLDKLDELGLADETIVCFTSDNGGLSTSEGSPTSNLPYRGGKGWVYEGGIREPFLIAWPGVTDGGGTCDVPVISTDFYPTLLDIAGLPGRPEQTLDGVSLAPVLTGAADALDRDALFWHYPHYSNQGGFPGGAIREGDLKLIERFEDGRVNLYDLASDPGERLDLAAERPEVVDRLRDRLHRWYEEVGAEFLRAREVGPEPWRP
ncbi:sulfatase [Tautonia plasticadhaerens]|uniref:Arylsulfatase n=1 Tax=Tautonia plasticadhaerens TaxID=2527974 RepID=A0A518GYK1_9BACT|nr:sulfatase [Tautonia plasticadhaerens]QDV33678.1 Arylsulfatase [Tautonia plasticadhaerens]